MAEITDSTLGELAPQLIATILAGTNGGESLPTGLAGRLASIAEGVPDGILVIDAAHVVRYANPAMAAIAGVPADALVGTHLLDGFGEETIRHTVPAYHRALEIRQAARWDIVPVTTPTGRLSYQSGWWLPVAVDGQVKATLCVVREATEMERQRVTQARLLEISRHLTSSLEPAAVLDAIAQGAQELLDAIGVAVYLLSDDGATLRPVVALEPTYAAQVMSSPIPVDGSHTGRAVQERRAMAISDAGHDGQGYRIPETEPLPDEHILAAPLVSRDDVVGALCVWRSSAPFDAHDIEAFEALAVYAAVALRNAQLHAHLDREHRQFRQMAESLREGIVRVDVHGNITYLNPRLAEMLGYTAEELAGQPITNLMDQTSAAANEAVKKRRRAGLADRYPCTFRRRDGSTLAVEVTAGPLHDSEGVHAGAIAAVTDLTERDAWLAQLHESEQRFHSLYHHMNSGAIIYRALDDGADFEIVAVNRAAEEMDGYRAEDVIGERLSIVAPEVADSVIMDALRRVWRSGESERLAPWFWDGRTGRGWRRNRIFRLPSGEVVAVFGDTTAMMEARQEAARNARLLDAIVQVQREALACTSEGDVGRAALDAAQAITGGSLGFVNRCDHHGRIGTLAVSDPGWEACRMPREEALASLQDQPLRGVRALALSQGQTVMIEHAKDDPRVGWMPEGHPRMDNLLVAPVRHRDGTEGVIAIANKPGGFSQADAQSLEALAAAYAQALDHKQDEIALRRSEQTLQVMLDAPEHAALLTTADGTILALNKVAAHTVEHRTGVTHDKAIGQRLYDLLSSDAAASRRARIDQVLASGAAITWEEEEPAGISENTVVPILDPDGQVRQLACFARDITLARQEQRAAERRRETLERLHRLALEINQPQPRSRLHAALVRGAAGLMEADRVGLNLMDSHAGGLALLAYHGAAIALGTVTPLGKGICGRAALAGSTVQVPDYDVWEGAIPPFEGTGLCRALAAPLTVGERLIGVLSIGSTRQTGVYAAEEIQLFSLYAAQAALALENARLLEEAQEAARTNLRLAQEVNHRVKNSLTAVLALLEGERLAARDDATWCANLERLRGRVHGLAAAHNLLSGASWETVPLGRLVEQVVGMVARAVPQQQRLVVEHDCDPIDVSPDQARGLALIANELATNTIKHALGERCEAHLRVTARAKRGSARLCFRDDGPGCDPADLAGEGMSLVRDLVRSELHGRIYTRTLAGLDIIILFPLLP